MVDGVSGSGFSNAQLEAEVGEAIALLPGDSVSQEMLDAAGTSILVSAAFAAREPLRVGRVEPHALGARNGRPGRWDHHGACA